MIVKAFEFLISMLFATALAVLLLIGIKDDNNKF